MIETILLDNPEVDEEVNRCCQTHPEYQTLESDCSAKWQALQEALIAWADAESAKWGFLSQAYYHRGLGLRQELFSVLGRLEPPFIPISPDSGNI